MKPRAARQPREGQKPTEVGDAAKRAEPDKTHVGQGRDATGTRPRCGEGCGEGKNLKDKSRVQTLIRAPIGEGITAEKSSSRIQEAPPFLRSELAFARFGTGGLERLAVPNCESPTSKNQYVLRLQPPK